MHPPLKFGTWMPTLGVSTFLGYHVIITLSVEWLNLYNYVLHMHAAYIRQGQELRHRLNVQVMIS